MKQNDLIKSLRTLTIGIFSALLLFVLAAYGDEKASPDDVMERVKAAALYLQEKGEAGLEDFNDPDSGWAFKDTYVWVLDCKNGTDAAHPFKPKLVGMALMGLRDTTGKLFFAEMCDGVKQPGGDWIEYQWPKVGEDTPSRKLTYVLDVPGQPYEVAAGIYDEDIPLEQLKGMIRR